MGNNIIKGGLVGLALALGLSCGSGQPESRNGEKVIRES